MGHQACSPAQHVTAPERVPSASQQAYIVGPNFAASLSAGAGLWNTGASFAPASANSLAGTPSLLSISSNGADGANPGSDKQPGAGSYNAGAGGNVAITQNATLLLSVANLSTPSGDVIPPWVPIGSALLATSQSGVGSNPATNSLSPGSGGNGGAVSVTSNSGSSIAIANNANAGTLNGITALSSGNSSGIYYDSEKAQGHLEK